MSDASPSRSLGVYLADTTLAVGLRYGRWVERAPSTEEQVAVSNMSQDKLGHAREFYQTVGEQFDESALNLQHERPVDEFTWNPAWLTPIDNWAEFVLAQVLLGRALLEDVQALADSNPFRTSLDKIQQEESWHARHGSAWLSRAGSHEEALSSLQAALDEIWPAAVAYHGVPDEDPFTDDLARGATVRDNTERRAAWLDEVVPQLEDAGLDVSARRTDNGWSVDPVPSPKLVDEVRAQGQETALELAAMLQDPANSQLADL